MNLLKRVFRFIWPSEDAPLTAEQEQTLRTLRHLVKQGDGWVDDRVRADWERFQRDFDGDEQHRRNT